MKYRNIGRFVITVLIFSHFLGFVSLVKAGNATVNVYVKNSNNQGLSGVEISCYSKDPNGEDGIPSAPIYTYLKTNSSGVATWTTNAVVGYDYKCSARTALVYINNVCYSLGAASPSGPYPLTTGQTLSVNIKATPAPGNCTYWGEPSDGDSSSQPTSNQNQTIEVLYAPVSKAKLPKKFRRKEAKTTNLSKLTLEDSKKVKNLIIDDTLNAMIKFDREIDLSDKKYKEIFEELDKYIIFEKGSVKVDTGKIEAFDVETTVSLYQISLVRPDFTKIAKNGEYDKKTSETAKYDSENKILVFTVDSFSDYKLMPDLELEGDESFETENEQETITGLVNDLDSEVEIILNGKKVEPEVKLDQKGAFEFDIELKEGENEVEVKATSVSGYSQTLSRRINRQADRDGQGTNWILAGVLISIFLLVSIVSFFIFLLIRKKVKNKK